MSELGKPDGVLALKLMTDFTQIPSNATPWSSCLPSRAGMRITWGAHVFRRRAMQNDIVLFPSDLMWRKMEQILKSIKEFLL